MSKHLPPGTGQSQIVTHLSPRGSSNQADRHLDVVDLWAQDVIYIEFSQACPPQLLYTCDITLSTGWSISLYLSLPNTLLLLCVKYAALHRTGYFFWFPVYELVCHKEQQTHSQGEGCCCPV